MKKTKKERNGKRREMMDRWRQNLMEQAMTENRQLMLSLTKGRIGNQFMCGWPRGSADGER